MHAKKTLHFSKEKLTKYAQRNISKCGYGSVSYEGHDEGDDDDDSNDDDDDNDHGDDNGSEI